MRKLFTLLIVMLLLSGSLWAQVSTYTYSGASGSFTPLTSGTLVAAATSSSAILDDNNYTGQVIPFTFNYNGVDYTSYTINTNGFITFGATAPSTSEYTPISSTTLYAGAIAVFAKDLDGRFTTTATRTLGSPVLTAVASFNGVVVGEEVSGTGIATGSTIVSFDAGAGTITLSANATAAGTAVTTVIYSGQIMSQTDGVSPNQVHTIQWRNFKRYGSGSSSYNGESYTFQIKLYETSNVAEIVYGPFYSTTTSTVGQVGIRGASNADYNNRTTATNWAATTAGASNSVTCTVSSTILPGNGQKFIYTPPVVGTPLPPTTPSPANAALNVAIDGSVTWTFGANTVNYDLWFGPLGSMVKVVDNQVAGAGSYTYTGLANGTTYQWQVVEYNGALTTSGPVWNFTTICAPASGLSELFDAVTAPALANCWLKYTSPSFTSQTVTTTTSGPYSAPNCVSIYSSGATATADAPMLISPQLSNLGAGTHELRFYAKGASTNLSVIVGTMTDPAVATTFTPFQTVTGLNTSTYTEVIISFATYSGADTYIAFKHPLTTTYSNIYIDNVVWQPLPACPQPTALVTSGITNTTADLNWTNGGSETLWNVIYGPAGFDPYHDGTLISGISSHPYTLNPPLSANTSYDWYVQADCGVKSESVWSGPSNFTTSCDPIPGTALPFSENFDAMPAIGNNIIPACWKATSPSGTPWSSADAAAITYNDPCSSPNYVYVNWVPSAADKFLITPGFSLKANTSYDFKFNWVGDGYTGWTGEAMVNTSQTGTGATALGAPFVVTATTTTSACTPVSRSFVAPANGTYFFMVRVNNDGVPYDLGFDDFIVQESPACPDPTAPLAVPAGFQATLDWTSTATTFDIEWGATPYTFTGTANITGVTKPYLLTGLTPETGYTYKVMANCGGGLYSGWSAEKTFTTTVACPAPTALTAVPATTSADLGWTEPGGATLWNIEFGPAGFTPTGTPTHTGVTNPFNIGSLTAATSYTFYVQADCGGAGPSLWSGPKTFTTLCNAYPAPYLEQFTTWPPLCWDLTGGTLSWMQYSAGAVQCAKANFWSQSAGNTDIMTTPVIDVTGMATPALKFDWSHLYSATYPLDGMDVKVSDDNGATWTTVWTKVGAAFNSGDGAGNTTPGTFVNSGIIDLSSFGNMLLIRFVGNSGWGPDAYVDNVEVFEPIAHDALTSSVDIASLMAPGSVSPKATVKNNGSNTETFPVTMTIGTYTSTMTVTALAPGASQQVTFDPWTATLGTHAVNVCTELVGDLDPANDCKGKSVTVEILRKAYAYVAYDPTLVLPEGPAWFYVETPGTITSLGTTTSGQFIGAGTWANGVWYGSEYYDATVTPNGGGWWTIDPTTGAMTLVADINLGFAGIAFDKVANIMYGTNWNGTTNELYTINPLTGAFVLVGTFGGADLMINLAADGSGFLWGVGLTSDHLFKIDPVLLTATDIGASGVSLNYAQDMEYDYDNNVMYAAAYTTLGSLYTVNTTTGAFTLVGNFQGGSEITGFAIPEIPVIPLGVTATVTNATCFGGTNGAITTTVVGGTAPYTYLWSNLATDASLTGLAAGPYSVTVTDAAMGTATGSWTVTAPADLVLTGVVTNATCPWTPDGAIDLTVTGGTGSYTYLWSTTSTTEDISGVSHGFFSVTVTDANNCTKSNTWEIGVNDPVCNNVTVNGSFSGTVCFDAHITLTVVGVTIEAPSGNATFIAGQNILFQPGVVVQQGAYMHGYISNIFCSPADLPAVAVAKQDEEITSLSNAYFTLYPNPTNGNFTLVQKSEAAYGNVKVEVFNMNGSKVMTDRMTGEKKHEFSFSSIPAGVYFVKIVADGYVETIKLIKTR